MLFEELNLIDSLLKAIKKIGYKNPTEIQKKVIPILLSGKDLIGSSQTGTGKTAAFVLPILQKLISCDSSKQLKGIILEPTRELALQIEENIRMYGKYTAVTSLAIFGGVSKIQQINRLKNSPNIIVATPGRLLDLIFNGYIHLKDVDQLVIDEADRMLDMGMIHEVKKIIKKLPTERQNMLFSATMPNEIKKLISSTLNNPINIFISPESSNIDIINETVYLVEKSDKRELLFHILEKENIISAIIFVKTKFRANDINEFLLKKEIESDVIHRDRSQSARQRSIHDLKKGKIKILVATDLASRGLDIDNLSHVLNYDLPPAPETYIHRIGRTGRAGNSGIAISFCDKNEKKLLKNIEELTNKSIYIEKKHPFHMRDVKPTFYELQTAKKNREKKKYDFKNKLLKKNKKK